MIRGNMRLIRTYIKHSQNVTFPTKIYSELSRTVVIRDSAEGFEFTRLNSLLS